MTGERTVKPWFAGFRGLIGISIGLAAIAWVLDSILDSVILHDGTLLEQLLSPSLGEIAVRVLFGFVIIVFGTHTQLSIERRKRLEDSQRQSEEKYRMLVENILEGVFIIQDAKFQYVNEAFARTVGYNAGEITGRNFNDFVAPEDLEMVADRHSRRQAGENVPSEYEFHMMLKDGAKIVVNMNVGIVTYRGRVASLGILKDITERKRTEEKLRLQSQILETIEEGVFLVRESDGIIVYANPGFEQMFGYEQETIVGKHVSIINAPTEKTPQEISAEIMKALSEKGEWNGEIYNVRKDGTKFWCNANVSAFQHPEHGKVWISVHTDITERKLVGEELNKSKQLLERTFLSLSDAVFIIDSDTTKIIDCNKAASTIFGYEKEEMIGRITAFLHVDEEALAEFRKELYAGVEEKGFLHLPEFRMKRKNGGIFFTENTVIPLTDDIGKRLGWVSVVRDITRRKSAQEALRKSEEKFRGIFEQSPIAIELYDKTGKLIDANRSCLDIFGVNNIESVIGFKLFDDPNIPDDTKTRLSNGESIGFESVFDFELVKKARLYETTKSGKCYLDILIVPLTTEERESYGYLVHARDITKRKQAEEALRESEKELEEAVVVAEEERNKSNAIIAALGDGIIIQDTDYKIIYQNKVQNDLFGNRIGEYCYKAYEGRDTICEWCPVEITFRDGKIHRRDRAINTENGTMYYELISSPLKDSTGKIIAGVKVVRDITERKRAEEKLREGEQFLASIFESIQDGIGIIDKDMNILRVNTTIERWYPHTTQFIGRKCYEVYHGRSERCETCPAWRTLKTGKSAHDIVPKHAGGKEVGWAEIYSFPFFDTTTGQMKGVIEYVRDITERKQVEKEKDKLLKAIENSTDGITIADEKDRYIYVNTAYANIFGYVREELVGKTWREITPPELIPPTEKGLSITMHKMDIGVFNGEVLGLRRDGTQIPTEVRGTALWSENGNYAGHICIVRDITERKKVEEKLTLLSEAVEEAPDGVIIVDINGFIIYSNKAVKDIYNFSHDELIGKHVGELNVDPDFTGKVMIPEIRMKGKWVGELKVKKKNGQEFPIWLNASLVKDSKGESIALVGVIRDITERKLIERVLQESEERYRSLFEDSPVSLWEEDSSGIKKYIDALKNKGIENLRTYFDRHPKEVALCASLLKIDDVNKATINLFKAKSKSDLIDGLDNIFTDRSYETLKEELIAIAEGKTSFESEDSLKTLTGDRIHVSIRWVLTPGSEETYAKRLVSIIDITERKQAEEKIKKYTRELEESNRMKELFADIMHHDLLNPLNTANGFIELLKENETISQKKAYLETIERSLVKGMELIDSAMKYSNFESLKSIELEKLDLKKIIGGVIEDLTPLADNAGMEIINRITLKTPVRANKIIEEVFSNIISNAIKYASSGKKIILENENKGESLQVRVIDFGEGIKESEKTMIFERFRRGGKTGVKGSGLGLAIAGKIMELHNGRIWVEDNPEGGSIFIVEIPIYS